eukprot:EC790502.1.p1 GENE.EC790502.1~~EC790502.1.p1  ORF type:complete len:139 (+),score=22.04 EC790502.1:35-418(+)
MSENIQPPPQRPRPEVALEGGDASRVRDETAAAAAADSDVSGHPLSVVDILGMETVNAVLEVQAQLERAVASAGGVMLDRETVEQALFQHPDWRPPQGAAHSGARHGQQHEPASGRPPGSGSPGGPQ